MKLPIEFQSLDRIIGKEGRSKLLHQDAKLYSVLHQVKSAITQQHRVGDDRMDLHIEITKERRDPNFRTKAESLQHQTVDLSDSSNWNYLGRAFVLNTPAVENYGQTHITIAFFGRYPKPSVEQLTTIVQNVLQSIQ